MGALRGLFFEEMMFRIGLRRLQKMMGRSRGVGEQEVRMGGRGCFPEEQVFVRGCRRESEQMMMRSLGRRLGEEQVLMGRLRLMNE